MPTDCIFCKIAKGEVPADIIEQDGEFTVFWDIKPAAPVHILIIPNKHIRSINEAQPEDAALLGRLILKAQAIAIQQGVDQDGYRLLINVERGGGQSVFHLHLHLFGGKHLMAIHG